MLHLSAGYHISRKVASSISLGDMSRWHNLELHRWAPLLTLTCANFTRNLRKTTLPILTLRSMRSVSLSTGVSLLSAILGHACYEKMKFWINAIWVQILTVPNLSDLNPNVPPVQLSWFWGYVVWKMTTIYFFSPLVKRVWNRYWVCFINLKSWEIS